jgi:5-methyltetrahydrofolate--homocysteine methyltransferase
MATVKGDMILVKNMVSVVLACNNYEIVDLGVMVCLPKKLLLLLLAQCGHYWP